MKHLLFTLTFLFSLSSFSQTINGVPIDEIDTPYVQIVGSSRLMSNKVNIELNFGQNTKFFGNSRKESAILDANGKQVKFNSMVDALNFMVSNGYELDQAYAFVPDGGSGPVYHYLLRKRKK